MVTVTITISLTNHQCVHVTHEIHLYPISSDLLKLQWICKWNELCWHLICLNIIWIYSVVSPLTTPRSTRMQFAKQMTNGYVNLINLRYTLANWKISNVSIVMQHTIAKRLQTFTRKKLIDGGDVFEQPQFDLINQNWNLYPLIKIPLRLWDTHTDKHTWFDQSA